MDGGDGEELVAVAHASDLVEAEMIRGLLESAGIPSVLQHPGVDGPGLGFGLLNPGGGPRRVMVRANQSEEARALLAETPVEEEQADWNEPANAAHPDEEAGRGSRGYGPVGAYARIWAWSFGTMILAFGIFLLLRLV